MRVDTYHVENGFVEGVDLSLWYVIDNVTGEQHLRRGWQLLS